MAKKTPKSNPEKTTNHYKIHTDAINRLVNADKMELPKDGKLKDPAKQYRGDVLDRIPSPVKALFLKFWFNGAVCFFILWGLGLYIVDSLDMLVIMSLVLGIVTDVLCNNILRFIETIPGENSKWMMFPKKKFWTFFANIVYAFIIYYCVVMTYESINILINNLRGTESGVPLGVEPVLFGLFYMMFDLLFISMKNLMITIVKDAKNKVNKK